MLLKNKLNKEILLFRKNSFCIKTTKGARTHMKIIQKIVHNNTLTSVFRSYK